MKKICLSMVAAAAMLFSAQNVSAQVAPENAKTDKAEVAVQETADWRSIEITELPAEVQQALERDHAGAVVSEAFVKEKEGAKKFKLVVQTADGAQQELFADAQGNWIEKEKEVEQE